MSRRGMTIIAAGLVVVIGAVIFFVVRDDETDTADPVTPPSVTTVVVTTSTAGGVGVSTTLVATASTIAPTVSTASAAPTTAAPPTPTPSTTPAPDTTPPGVISGFEVTQGAGSGEMLVTFTTNPPSDGVAVYRLEFRPDGGSAWTTVREFTPAEVDGFGSSPFVHSPGGGGYRAAAIDAAGNRGPWVESGCVMPVGQFCA